MVNNYYVSFGQSHAHSFNGMTLDKDCLLLVQAEDSVFARECVVSLFGLKWSKIYPEEKLQEILPLFPRGVVNQK